MIGIEILRKIKENNKKNILIWQRELARQLNVSDFCVRYWVKKLKKKIRRKTIGRLKLLEVVENE